MSASEVTVEILIADSSESGSTFVTSVAWLVGGGDTKYLASGRTYQIFKKQYGQKILKI